MTKPQMPQFGNRWAVMKDGEIKEEARRATQTDFLLAGNTFTNVQRPPNLRPCSALLVKCVCGGLC